MTVTKKTIHDAIADVAEYLKARKEGTIQSLKTGQKKFDKYMLGGIEWNSTVTIGGRPSVGKSAFSDIIVEGTFEHNRDINGKIDHDLLDFNWELSSRVMLIRRLSAKLKKTYKHIISAGDTALSDKELEEITELLTEYYGNLPITFCEEPQTVKQFGDTVRKHIDETKRKTLIRVDHTLLTRLAGEGSQVQMLLNLMMEANSIKKGYPAIFLFLTQINREFEERQKDGTFEAYPKQGDVYGGDASAMFSETIVLLNKPSKYGIGYYGKRPSGIVVEPDDLFAHIVKNRNAEGDLIIHYKENFKHMSMNEF